MDYNTHYLNDYEREQAEVSDSVDMLDALYRGEAEELLHQWSVCNTEMGEDMFELWCDVWAEGVVEFIGIFKSHAKEVGVDYLPDYIEELEERV